MSWRVWEWRVWQRPAPTETAEERLERIVRETRESHACEQYRRRRAAALKGLGRA